MLKRLATAGILAFAMGGVLMGASPAMAGDHHYGHHHFHKHHFHKYHDKFDLDFHHFKKDIHVRNSSVSLLNCVNLIGGILGTVDQNCFTGNTLVD
ncbi:hypothetical protein [Thermomonospora catenispora]|uniref:hypothetical protein n=1 Tax=Thermomonospora catenispora TaxID=2493090 RepID=UPI001120A748|nr:hypothetical protein [Thermomonospora catenispora]TNY37938.1 hypothetical protein EIO00_04990 [Thermomonospora catenispora]